MCRGLEFGVEFRAEFVRVGVWVQLRFRGSDVVYG